MQVLSLAAGDCAAQFGVVEKRSASAFVADLGRFALGIQLVRCRSEPQIPDEVTLTITSVGSLDRGIGHVLDPRVFSIKEKRLPAIGCSC
jgi:hypothetical protein